MRNAWKKTLARIVVAVSFVGTTFAMAPMAEAVSDTGWGVAASAISGLFAYKSSLSMMLDIGNNADYQRQSYWQDVKANGTDRNARDAAAVDAVMQRLTQEDVFVLPADALPFVWHVNDDALFNAACYPTDYIAVNRGLVRVLDDENELAAVLGHEMTHGLEHHSASVYAKTMATYYGLSLLNMATGAMDWQQLTQLTMYSSAKLFTLPTEYAADAGGFRLMARAGFNPGGGAAAMARMGAYFKDQSQNFMEYEDPDEKKKENYNDHPDTELREARLAGLLTDYSAGHVTVKDRKDVCIDGQHFLAGAFTAEDYDNTAENAYLLAGELARLFHDNASADGWGLAASDWSRENAPLLTAALRQQGLKDTLSKLVTTAYAKEAKTGARKKLLEAEAKEQQELAKAREKLANATKSQTKRMRENSDRYSDAGDAAKARLLIERALASPHLDDHAETIGIRARARAVAGDFAGAFEDADAACTEDPKNVYNFLNRADIYWMQGDRKSAIASATQGVAADAKNATARYLRAMLYDEEGDSENALADYQKFHELAPNATGRIPDAYLKEIDPKAYDAAIKAREEAEKERIEAKKKEKEEKEKEQPAENHSKS